MSLKFSKLEMDPSFYCSGGLVIGGRDYIVRYTRLNQLYIYLDIYYNMYCKRWKAHRLDAHMLLCSGKVIEESASTCVADGRKACSISNSWLFASHMVQIPSENGCCETWMKTMMNT